MMPDPLQWRRAVYLYRNHFFAVNASDFAIQFPVTSRSQSVTVTQSVTEPLPAAKIAHRSGN